MKFVLKCILALITCWSVVSMSYSQETLEDKKKRAEEYFKDEKWEEAEPLFASVISSNPKNHDLNFKYGACLLYGSKNKEEAIKRLRYAVTGATIDPRAYFFLGRAYHLNYQFNDAIKQYKKFEQIGSSSDLKKYNIETNIKACNHGKKLLANVTDMVVLNKTELGSENFTDLYKLDDIGGTLLITDQFQSKYDKKMNHRPVIHFPTNSPYIYYSSYGEDGATGLDIYVIKKLPGGQWSLAQKVRGGVNTWEDEDYAYMHPNGRYLYYCSKGHNSMGGYDVFRSKYNPDDQSFGPSENLDFAISSPDDDLLYVVDSLNKTAYFSSTRASGQGRLTVYKVRVDRIPMQMAVIKGNYLNTLNGDVKEVEIEIEDFSSGRSIGKFNSKRTNGDYLITFPKSGKYRYIITPKDSDISHIYVVDIPFMKEFKPLKQAMTLKEDDNGEELVVVDDQFDSDFDDPVAVMAEVYRELSQLPPNAGQFNLDSLDALKATDEIFVDAGLDPFLTNDGLVAVMKDEIEDLTAIVETEKKQANIAYNLAKEKSDLANAQMLELNELLKEAETAEGDDKTRALQKVLKKKAEIEEINNEAQSLIELAQAVENSAKNKEKDIEDAKKVLAQAEAAEDGDRAALVAIVQTNNNFFQNNIKGNPEDESIVTEAMQAGAKEQKRVQSLSEEISALSKDQRELINKNKYLEKQLKQTKKKKVIEDLQRQIDENESEIIVLNRAIASKQKELDENLDGNVSVRSGLAAALVLKDDYEGTDYEKELTAEQRNAITMQVRSNDLEENLAIVDQMLEDNDVSAFNIELYANDEQTSTYSLEDWNEAIDAEKEKLRQQRLMASEERQRQIDAEIERLEKLRAEKEAEFELVVETDPRDIKPEINQDDIVPNYTRKKESIGEIVNEEDRKKAEVELNYEVLDEIEKERKRLEEILADDPKAKNVKDRLDNLQIVEDEIKADIKADEEWIVDNGGEQAFNADEVVSNLDPNYQRKLNDAYEIVDDSERAKAIEDLNEIVLEKSNERIQELEAILAADPDNQKAKEELEYLQDFVQDVASNKAEPLMEPETMDVETLTAKVEVTDLMNDYDSRMKVISGIKDEYERRKAENELYKELIDKARSQVAMLDRMAEKNPDNKTIGKRQDALLDIDKDYNKLLEKNKEWMAENAPVTPVFADNNNTQVRMANADYQLEIDKIEKLPNEEFKQTALKNLNEETLAKIEERLAEINQAIDAGTATDAEKKEKEELEALKATIEENPTRPLLAASTEEDIITNPDANALMTDYDAQLTALGSSGKTPEEQEKERLAINEQLVDLIDGELENIEDMKLVHPDWADKLDERATALNRLKAITQGEIEAGKERLDNGEFLASNGGDTNNGGDNNDVRRPDVSVASLMPSYEADMAAIDGSDKTKREKFEEENALNEMLIGAIDWKIKSLEEEKQGASADEVAAIDNEIAALNEIKEEKNTAIDGNEDSIAEIIANPALDRPTINEAVIDPEYESRLTAIDNNGSSQADQIAAKNSLHQDFIDDIDQKIASLEAEKSNNPELTEVVDQEIDKLNEIKAEKLAEIEVGETTLAQLNNGGDNTNDQAGTNNGGDNTNNGGDNTNDQAGTNNNRPDITVGSLSPSYESNIAAIESSGRSDAEKLEEKNKLNNALITAIDNKIAELESEKSTNPALAAAIDNEIGELNNLKRQKENEIESNEADIASLNAGDNTNDQAGTNNGGDNTNNGGDNTNNGGDNTNDQAGTNTNRPAISIGSLSPSYESNVAAIESSGQSEADQLEEKNKLNNALITVIDNKIAELENEKDTNPALAATIDNEISELSGIKREKENEIEANNADIASLNNGGDQNTGTARPIISVGGLMTDYQSQLTDISNGAGTDKDKLARENEIHQRLIAAADEKIAELEAEKSANSANAAAIDKDIEKVQEIKRNAMNAVSDNNDEIAELGGGTDPAARPSISIGSLLPEFESEMNAVDQSGLTEEAKLARKNELNNELIDAIETKIAQVEEELENDPDNRDIYKEELDKLQELLESKRSDVAQNNEAIADLNGGTADIAALKVNDFNTVEGKAAVTAFEAEQNEINELSNEIDALNDALNNTDNEKDKAKIQKSIDKAEAIKAGLENEIIEGLEEANEAEVKETRNALSLDKDLVQGSVAAKDNGLEADLAKANENLIVAEQKMNQAQELRDEAADTKDRGEANEKLKEAFELEEEAKDLVNESKRIFKMARAANNLADETPVITDVASNPADRKSTELMDEAAALREAANVYYDRAKELRDSSATVKQKYRDAIAAQANEVEQKGDELSAEADDIENRADELATQENEVAAAQIDEVNKSLNETETENTATSDEYKEYFAAKNAGDEKLAEAEAIEEEITELKNKRARRFKMAVAADNSPEGAIASDNELAETQRDIDALTRRKEQLRDEAMQNYRNAKEILNSQSNPVQENMMALEQKDVAPYDRRVEVASADFEVPQTLDEDIFRTTDEAVYSNNTPIPVDQQEPVGLVYKIQVGAFRNPLPQDHFKEFAPISGEKLNNGITRYMVGYFTKFAPADEAKVKVHDIGYGDAFVVAYCNGERITIDRARQIEQGLIACDGTAAQNQNNDLTINNNGGNNTNNQNTGQEPANNGNDNVNNTNDNENNGGDEPNNNGNNNDAAANNNAGGTYVDQSETLDFTPQTDEERRLASYYTNTPDAAKANQVEIIDGLFYTVQIGVYSKPVPNSALFNIQPLNSQRAPNGYIRYSTGIFTSVEEATVRKEEVVQIGVTDAFVTAYYKGQRITIEEAYQILLREGAEALVGNKSAAELQNGGQDTNPENGGAPEREMFYKEGLHYRILVGKYDDAIPGEYATLLLQGDDIFETEVDAEGRTCLISSKLDSYQELEDRLAEFADLGIEDMQIITYYKYDVIPFAEGEKIRNEEEIDAVHPYNDMQGISANDFVYKKDAVYFKIKLGEFEDKVPADFTNLLLLYEVEENINKEETINDETVFYTGSFKSYQEASETRTRLLEKGFDRAIIIAYHKYDEISVDKAREILGE